MENERSKIIIFGSLPSDLAKYLDVKVAEISLELKKASECEPALTYEFSESKAIINFKPSLGRNFTHLPSRPLCRYDFTNEWNNLGYGVIKTDGSIWSVRQEVVLKVENTMATFQIHGKDISGYIGIWDKESCSLIWFNRSVGPVDSYDWRLVEEFICNYQSEELPCWPVISEIPYGYDAAVTMRLDCDEDVESARGLFEAYKEMQVPFSLALHAKVLENPIHHQLAIEVDKSGGAILSHTLTHAPNWGGSHEAAKNEGRESAKIIGEIIGHKPKYAVSPFHHTPRYARDGLADAGYQGCVGGIISSDPDYLMARAGKPPFAYTDFIGHSQQCMLHGDCLLRGEDPLIVFKNAFNLAIQSKTFFGYLDHPFSDRYQYGWENEAQRINSHKEFIVFMKNTNEKIFFSNEIVALDFLKLKSKIQILGVDEKLLIQNLSGHLLDLQISIEYKNKIIAMSQEELIL
jgi:peptidoglycan/xylan/chitin deacetylase (PgdA/CDA1 family)